MVLFKQLYDESSANRTRRKVFVLSFRYSIQIRQKKIQRKNKEQEEARIVIDTMELFAAKLSTISVFMFWLCMFDANGDVIDSASDITPSDKILSRKRRYLIFPAGSSIQLGE